MRFDEISARKFLSFMLKELSHVEIRALKNKHHKKFEHKRNTSFIADNVEDGIKFLRTNSGHRNCYVCIGKIKKDVVIHEKHPNHEYTETAISDGHIEYIVERCRLLFYGG